MIQSKQDALAEITLLLEDARALLAREITSEQALSQAELARATWLLRLKKALHELMGDSAGLVRLASSRIEPEGAVLTLADQVRSFQQTVLEHVRVLDKVGLLLKHLA